MLKKGERICFYSLPGLKHHMKCTSQITTTQYWVYLVIEASCHVLLCVSEAQRQLLSVFDKAVRRAVIILCCWWRSQLVSFKQHFLPFGTLFLGIKREAEELQGACASVCACVCLDASGWVGVCACHSACKVFDICNLFFRLSPK